MKEPASSVFVLIKPVSRSCVILPDRGVGKFDHLSHEGSQSDKGDALSCPAPLTDMKGLQIQQRVGSEAVRIFTN